MLDIMNSKIISNNKFKMKNFIIKSEGLFYKFSHQVKGAVIPLILCFGLSLPLPSCRSFKTPELKYFQQVKLSQIGLSKSTMTAQVVCYNPNKFGYKIKNFGVDIYINNHFLGRSTSSQLINVAKMASFTLPVEMKINMKNLPINTWNIITKKKVRINAKGTVMVGLRGLYKEVPVKYEGEQELNLF
jgi:LEA14-like dessication related protein